VIRMLVCLSVSETTSSGTPWVSMIDATGLVLATRGVRHQDLGGADGNQLGTPCLVRGISQDLGAALAAR